jgi:hypothetical protein
MWYTLKSNDDRLLTKMELIDETQIPISIELNWVQRSLRLGFQA